MKNMATESTERTETCLVWLFHKLQRRNQPKGTFVRRSDPSISSPYISRSASPTVCLEARHAENHLVIRPLQTHLPDQLTIHEEDKAECIDC